MSVITTSAPMRASVSASSRPRPREAPVTRATLPERSNMRRSPFSLLVSGFGRPQLRPASGQHRLALLVERAQVRLCGEPGGAEGDRVARPDHAGEAAAQPAKPGRVPGDASEQAHLQQAVGYHSWQPYRAREFLVQVDRVAVAGGLRVGLYLLPGEGDRQLAHPPAPLTTKSALDRQIGA